uniref:NADH-ubiquinone oxidoreductase chain 6 n=1 Tax=Chthonerpeton indistinctum TaxID=420416 RepID=W5RHA9_CHTIN|nr:NADH dehydrogenase subunit 6 [Chthonerpeton indistinctum]AGZ18927.1 NADH dehydrogenase subunit 6 [Chthonerpeton indistinctum]
MSYMVYLSLAGLVFGLVGVAANPSPYFAALGLVVAAASGCVIMVWFGMNFLSLVLFLIYLGGMLVVFAYSAALAAESYPFAWGDWSVISYVIGYSVLLWIGVSVVDGDFVLWSNEFMVMSQDWSGVSILYNMGGKVLVVLGWVLLLTLFVVLEVTRVVLFVALVNI